jgi:hypothetical protein
MNELVESPFAAEAPLATAGARQSESREVAEIQTQYLMAQRFPRDPRASMDGIINAFARPRLAERAQYEYARGGNDITGPSIHAAQAIAQQWGNVAFGWQEFSRGVGPDGVPYSEVKAYATDLQARVPRDIKFICRHWRDTKKGGYKLSDERDIYELCANMAQRRVRACILAVVPQDVIDTAMEQAEMTLKAKADTSPEAMAKMVDAFSPYAVTKEQIEKLIQRRLDSITPAQVIRLKRIYTSLRDGMSEPAEWFEIEPPAPKSTQADAVKEALKTKDKAPPKQEPAPPPPKSLAKFMDEMAHTKAEEPALLVLDEARGVLSPEQHAELAAAYHGKYPTNP